MKFYAYKVTTDNEEPMGTFNRLLFELKTNHGAIKRALRILVVDRPVKVFSYINFYDSYTFIQIFGPVTVLG